MLGHRHGARRPLGRTTIHVAIVVVARLRPARRRGRLLGRRPGARPRPLTGRRRRHRRRPDRAAREDPRPRRHGPGRQQDGRERRARTGSTPDGPSARSSATRPRRYGRAGLERAYDAELSGLAGDDLSDAFAKFGADRYDPKDLTLSLSYDLQRAAVAALGKRRGAVVMLDPRDRRGAGARLDPDVRRVGDRRPGHGQDDVRGAPGRSGPAAPAARDAGPVRARARCSRS